MSHVFIDVKFTNQTGDRTAEANVMVDTCATYTVIPRGLAQQLALPGNGKRTVKTAAGDVEMPMSWLFVDFAGWHGPTHVLIGDQIEDVLLGVVTLEEAGLSVDPSSGELKSARAFLY